MRTLPAQPNAVRTRRVVHGRTCLAAGRACDERRMAILARSSRGARLWRPQPKAHVHAPTAAPWCQGDRWGIEGYPSPCTPPHHPKSRSCSPSGSRRIGSQTALAGRSKGKAANPTFLRKPAWPDHVSWLCGATSHACGHQGQLRQGPAPQSLVHPARQRARFCTRIDRGCQQG
jgi:hypothetical protein